MYDCDKNRDFHSCQPERCRVLLISNFPKHIHAELTVLGSTDVNKKSALSSIDVPQINQYCN